MAYSHEPLSEAELGPAVLKFAGPAAPDKMRLMVARGLAPLPPRDLLVALYHFWVTNEPELAETAGKTVEGLPPPVIKGALDDPKLHPGVLDLLGRKLTRKEELLDRVVRHPMVHDETLAGVARVCPEGVCETLAENQERWLRFPAIVSGLYNNRNCRMSVVHRMLELAEREGIDVKLPAMEEIRQAMKEVAVDETRDDIFKAAVGGDEDDVFEVERLQSATVDDDLDLPMFAEEEGGSIEQAEALADAIVGTEDAPAAAVDASKGPEVVGRERRLSQLIQMNAMEKIRAALLGDRFDRSVLVRDSNKTVAMAAIKSPKVRDDEAVAFAANRALGHDVVRYIANRREWIKLYQVKFNLVMNPKTPMSRSMTLLTHLSPTDVRKVARSKNIPSALAQTAKRKEQSRK
jgi:hypothetical protein